MPYAPERQIIDVEAVIDEAVHGGDEHAIKFAEVAVESHRRGRSSAVAAAARANELINHASE